MLRVPCSIPPPGDARAAKRLRVVPCSQPDPLEPPGTTAPVRGVIVLLGVDCCFHGLECGVKKALRGADFAREARFELSCSVHRLRAVECSLRTFHWVRWRISGASQARRPRVSVEEMRHPVALKSQPNAISLRVPHRWLACRHRFFALSIRCVGAGRMPRRQPRCSLLGSFASPAKSSSEATAVWALHQPSSPFEAGIGVARGICAGRELPRRSCASGRAKRSPSDRLPL